MKIRPTHNHGFTVIELLVVIVVVCVLGLFVALAYSGVRSKDRNVERRKDIDTLKSQLELYYAEANSYPTLANANDAVWRAAHLAHVSERSITDPNWSDHAVACLKNNKPILATTPGANCYSYQVTGSDGNACDNAAAVCAHYTLTATLEGGGTYVKSSLN